MMMRGCSVRFGTAAVVLVALVTGGMNAVAQEAKRPRITGISHVAFYVSDLPKAIAFWHDFLGYDEAYDLKKPDGSGVRIAFIKINDHQHIELFNEPPRVPHNMLSHLCFTVDDIEQMRAYLRSKGIDVPAGKAQKTRAGDYAFEIKDPDGTLVEFVQTLPTGMEAKAAGKFVPETRVSKQIYHVGFLVGDSQKAMDFYGGILGFTETWRGGGDPKVLSWINMKVPDGEDYIEFMLYGSMPDWSTWGGRNHVALVVPDAAKAVETLEARPAFKEYGKPLKIATGVNQKRQVNIFDPDGTRAELMEPKTVTGKPTPPSTAPPPVPVPR
jgi:lactoylglutathione lyase